MQNKGIAQFLQSDVEIVTSDSKLYQGYLVGIDQALNLALQHCYEISEDKPPVAKGLFVVRGENVTGIGNAAK